MKLKISLIFLNYIDRVIHFESRNLTIDKLKENIMGGMGGGGGGGGGGMGGGGGGGGGM